MSRRPQVKVHGDDGNIGDNRDSSEDSEDRGSDGADEDNYGDGEREEDASLGIVLNGDGVLRAIHECQDEGDAERMQKHTEQARESRN